MQANRQLVAGLIPAHINLKPEAIGRYKFCTDAVVNRTGCGHNTH
jgi:hypothetical protein